MLETRHHWLPVFIAIYLPLSFIITYSIAVGNDHVEPGFPYISDTGTKSPESCVFGQLLNIGAVISGIIVYVRYRHIHTHFMTIHGRNGMLRLNQAAFVIGMLTNLGVSLVGNFQETNILIVHLIGAFLAFGVGFVYMILQTIISHKTVGVVAIPGCTLFVRRFRVILCVADVILLIILISAFIVYVVLVVLLISYIRTSSYTWVTYPTRSPFDHRTAYLSIIGPEDGLRVSVATMVAGSKGPRDIDDMLQWSPSDPGHTEHVIATASEWVVAFVTVAYFASFYTEFKHFRMQPPEVKYYDPEALKDQEESQRQETPIAIIS